MPALSGRKLGGVLRAAAAAWAGAWVGAALGVTVLVLLAAVAGRPTAVRRGSVRGERVALVVPAAEGGCGVAAYAADLARHMEAAGAEVDLVVFRRHDRNATTGSTSGRRVVYELDDRDARAFARAGAWVGRSGRYGLVVAQHEFGVTVRGGTELGALLRAAREASGGAVMAAVTLHSPFVRPSAQQARDVARVASEADRVVVMAEAAAAALVGAYGVDRSKVRVVPHGAEGGGGRAWTGAARASARAWLGLPADQVLLVTAGLMHERKGADLMARAMRAVCAAARPSGTVTYAVVGEHDRRMPERVAAAAELRSLAAEVDEAVGTPPGAPRCVVIREDFVPSFRELLAAADVVVAPYLEHTEVSGVITQAVSLGVPLLASDTRYALWSLGAASAAEETRCGVLVPQGDLDGLARGASLLLARVRGDPEAAWARREQCSADALARHAWERVARSHLDLLLGTGGGGGERDAVPQVAPLPERERVAEVMLGSLPPPPSSSSLSSPACLLSAAQIEVEASLGRDGVVTVRLAGGGRVDVAWRAASAERGGGGIPRVTVDGSSEAVRPGARVAVGGEGLGRTWAHAARGWWEVVTPAYLVEGSSDGLLRVVDRHALHAISSGVLGTDGRASGARAKANAPACAAVSRFAPGNARTSRAGVEEEVQVEEATAVVHVGPFYEASGFAEVNRALAQELAAASDAVLWSGADQDPEISPAGGQSLARDSERARWKSLAPRIVQHVGREPRARGPRHASAVVLGNAWPALGPSWRMPVPSASVWLQNQPWEYSSVPCAWERQIEAAVGAGLPLKILVPSAFSRRAYIAGGVDPRLVSVVPHGVDAARFKPTGVRLHLPGATRLLFLGGALPRKGLDVLLRVFRDTFPASSRHEGDDDDDVVLYVVSNYGALDAAAEWPPNVVRLTDDRLLALYRDAAAGGALRAAARRARGRRAQDKASAPEDVLPDVMPALLRSVDALVAPFRGEGFGLALAQAMAAELPVVATRGGPALELCGPVSGDRCILVDATLSPCDPPAAAPAAARESLRGECADTFRVSALNGVTCVQPPVAWFLPSESDLARVLRDLADPPDRADRRQPHPMRAMARRAREAVLRDGFTWANAAHRVLHLARHA